MVAPGSKAKTAPVYKEYQASSPSLKGISATKNPFSVPTEEKQIEDISVNDPNVDFQSDALETAWKKFTNSIEKQMPRMHQVLLTHLPSKINPTTISIQLDNTSQQKDFMEKLHSKLSGFLKTELELNQLEIQVAVAEEITSQNIVYTNSDKYNFLAEQNELLHKLQKTFNLDFE
ncbi:MAG TPA: hypothetical protein DCQ26_13180 [Marinilabiliales bacterium]|nr:hypothetical protein [Marinilabiliales bacterium]HBO73899.1 hypothetical protein [Marinilabiliales bacterium]HBX84099.1 hypothetical protein [Marinilabiliales bacterium]HBY52952.1 hypothetical protein [Marinilabiliales bacterium]